MFELGARPHPPQALYRAYLEQSDVFVGIYWRRYGWVAPGMEISGLEDEYVCAPGLPKLVYVKQAGEEREPELRALLERIAGDRVSYRYFESDDELEGLLADDLALLVSERFGRSAAAATLLAALPAPVSSFVGRQREVAEVEALVGREDVRLLTLTGAGGIGKTRLAIEASRFSAGQFRDGVAFVSLAAVSDPDDVAPAIAEALGVRTEGPVADALCARLEALELLLVLDNLEHVVSASPLIARLLSAAPRLTVLATSRVRLDVSGEHLFQVPPMGMPDASELEAETIEQSDAVRLFSARAEAAGWKTSEADALLVSDLVRRLDGLPLAIELAAAQARLVPAELVHTRLRRRLDLSGGPRDAEERHRTLRSTIAWSYDLLDETARRVFESLSVFVGGFSLDAAEAVVGVEDTEGVIASLVDASLVTTAPAPASVVRFGMLETIREFADERLRERGGHDEAAARHLAFFAQLADEAYEARPERRLSTRLQLDENYHNLRAALDEATRIAPVEAVRLAGALGGHFDRRGLTRIGREVIAAALAAAPEAPPKWRARALLYAAWMAAEHDECDEADSQAREALALFRSLEDHHGVGSALNTLGYSAAVRGDESSAVDLYQQSYDAFSAADRDWALYPAANLATVLLASRRDLDRARDLFSEAFAYFDKHEFEDEAATVRLRMSELEEALGDLEAAHEWAESGVTMCRRIGNTQLLAWTLLRIAHIDAASSRFEDAARSYAEGFDIHVELSQRSGIAYSVECIARLALRDGRGELAARLLGCAGRLRGTVGVPMPQRDREEADETEAQTRAALGDEEFERENGVGAAMSLDELVELVHEVLAVPARSG